MDKSLDQIVVNLAKAMIGKTQQIQKGRGRFHALQLVGRIELDQRSVIFAALIGKFRHRQKVFGKFVQWLKELPALGFAPQFLVTEVLRFVLECADPVHAFVGFEKHCQLLVDRRCHAFVQQLRNARTLTLNHTTDHFLQKSIARSDNALLGQVLHQFPENINWLR